MRNPRTTHIDRADTLSMLEIINDENKNAVLAVEKALPEAAKAVEAVTEAFGNGGRLFYIGCGTSGRLAVLDAAECPPTFGVEHTLVNAVIAGGEGAMFRAAENAEDSGESGVRDLEAHGVCKKDVVVGISASGNADYVASALKWAKEKGCVTVALTSNRDSKIDVIADISIVTDTGEEVVTGSTRMKAGTAQKLVLNMISTCAMIKTGKVYENLMINLRPSNKKLKERMKRIVSDISGVSEDEAVRLLCENGWDIRKAVGAAETEK